MATQIIIGDQELDALAEEAGIYSAPHSDDPRTCSHAWGFELNPEIIPAWLIDVTDGQASAPEVPDAPQAFRIDRYVDWSALAASRRRELKIVDDWGPTARCLEIVDELRDRGYDARIQADIYILHQEARRCFPFLRHTTARRLVFGVQIGAIAIYDAPDGASVLKDYHQDITDALGVTPTAPGELPMHAIFDGHDDFAHIYFTA